MSDSHQIEMQPDNHGSEDSVLRKIKADLSSSLSSSSSTEQPEICKIRKVQPHDNWDYTPKIISIGPLHHGKSELKPMEELKHRYVNQLINRRRDGYSKNNDFLLSSFISEARKMEEEVRNYYESSNINTISSDDFVRMLVIDGCFLLEFLFRTTKSFSDLRGNYDETISDDLERQGPLINHDIQLFENQIPFFVLENFYTWLIELNSFYGNGRYGHSIVEVAHCYMMENHVAFGFDLNDNGYCFNPTNLLHLRYMYAESFWSTRYLFVIFSRGWNILWSPSKFFIYFIYKIFFADITYPTELISATAIEEAGVRLQGSRMDLRFEKGTLTFPVLTLNQESLCILKNLMVFEFYFRSLVPPYVHEYVSFLSILIKSPGDLKVMEKHHIIRTSGGGDESFALVNKLIQSGFEELMSGKKPMTGHSDLNWPSRSSIIDDLKTYCKDRRHQWRAKLMKDYFGNPWSTLSVLAGVILLVLTALQTAFTLVSYYHK